MCNFGIGHYEEHSCEIILSTSGSGGDFTTRFFLFLALLAIFFVKQYHVCNFGRWHYGERSCEIILKIWTNGSGDVVKDFSWKILFLALPAILINGAEPYVQFW